MLRIAMLLCIVAQFEFNGFAQSSIITTYAGSNFFVNGSRAVDVPIGNLSSMALDGSGGFYFCSPNLNRVFRVAADGTISVIAGFESANFSGDGGPATLASLSNPQGIAVDSIGNIYIADTGNSRIRKVTPTGIISTVAGNGTNNDGVWPIGGSLATATPLGRPTGIAVDSRGNIYIADSYYCAVFKVDSSGMITWATNCVLYGTGPDGLAIDSVGNLYIADNEHHRILKVNSLGIITTIAGTDYGNGFSGDGGPATAANLLYPSTISVDAAGTLYISDSGNNRIRRVAPSGIISTVAGNGTAGFRGDGSFAISASLSNPNGVAVDSFGNLYIADSANKRIRKVDSSGMISTVAGNGDIPPVYGGDGGVATAALLNYPTGVAGDSAGNIYIADHSNCRIRKITAAGVISTVVAAEGDACPQSVTVDPADNLYFAENKTCLVRKIDRDGVISTVAGNKSTNSFYMYGDGSNYLVTNCFHDGDGGPATSAHVAAPKGIAVDSAGNLYIAEHNPYYGTQTGYFDSIRKVTPGGMMSTVAIFNQAIEDLNDYYSAIAMPNGVAVDSAGNVYIADSNFNRIRKVDSSGIISTIAGKDLMIGGFSGDGGIATAAQLNYPTGVAIDPLGNLYIVDSKNSRIRMVDSAGIINTVIGTETAGYSGDGGPAASAQLNNPAAIAFDSRGSLYIADTGNNRIRKVATPYSPTVTTAIVSSIMQTTATGGGNVSSDGGAPVTAKGICWSLSPNPTTADSCTSNGAGTGAFNSSITGLTSKKTYHVRAYATNSAGTAYGADVSFTTLVGLALVTTTPVASIGSTTATGGGNVTDDGGASVTTRGVCWSLSANPTLSDDFAFAINVAGTGSFTSSITRLTPNKIYHVRAYAINSVGIAYGSDVSFTTLPPADVQISAASNGSLSATVAAGSNAVYNLTISGVNEFSGNVSFSCSSLPTDASCTIDPATMTISGAQSLPLTVTIKTTIRTTSGAVAVPGGSHWNTIIPAFMELTCLGFFILIPKQRRLALTMAGLLCAFGLSGCGGGGSVANNNTQPTIVTHGTPAGTYTVGLKISGDITRTINLTLTVQ